MVSLQVDVLLSRDLDSRLSPREVSAVEEWMNTSIEVEKDKPFHVMRDHPDHGAVMLGEQDKDLFGNG